VQHAPIVLWALDRDGTVTVSEGAGLHGMGYKPGELVGRSAFELYKDNPAVLTNMRRVLDGETFTTVNDVGAVILETWMGPLLQEDGRVSGIIGVATDVTARLQLQHQMTQSDRLAALGRLAASVAHEINNPLAYATEALRLAGELLEDPAGAPGADGPRLAQLKALLADAAEGADRVRLITRDLSAFSRADEDVRRPVDLNRVVNAAVKLVGKRIGVRARLELALGPSVCVPADENRLIQIFTNLLLNAADALPVSACERNVVSLSSVVDGDHVTVSVADNGPGVPEGLRERIFDPFFTTKPVGEGTGLGLFVTRNLVAALGGTITLGAAPHGGALFTLRLPTAPSDGGANAVAAATPRPRANGRSRVLIVDDELQLARIFQKSLEPEYEVRVLTSGREALDHLAEPASRAAPYDLVLCDLMMPDMSGMQLYEELRQRVPGAEASLIFMTGGVFDPQVGEFLASIPNECIDKPFDVRVEVRRRVEPRHN
jgi:PAS domain S-box-containing protein